ncbi:hypothetical protein [Streptomyces yunnanensis]|uniref:hypothetical protein n=1 Tax=Streptomyces yunnanensis TaxID=156453 RepID=UPI0025705A9A|nr:hypothetical protein [Streptomyces yunnanensis]
MACADHLLLRCEPTALAPLALAPFSAHYVQAPARFLPLLGRAFDGLVPWGRMGDVHRVPVLPPRPLRGVTVRRLRPADAPAVAALEPESAWIHASWEGREDLAASGHGWATFEKDRVLALACTYFRGSAYEDVAILTVPRRHHRAAVP